MMMGYQELYPLGNIVIKAQLTEQLCSYCRAFLFLQLAAAAAVFFFAGVNSYIVGTALSLPGVICLSFRTLLL